MKHLVELTRGVDLSSLKNDRTRELTLYVMQNAHGLVKIGRSDNPEQRRLNLERDAHCRIAIVAAFPEAGHFEEWIHLQLDEHHVVHEWFSGCAKATQAIEGLVGTPLEWPFLFAEHAANAWVERLKDAASERYWRRRERELIRKLKAAATGEGRYGKYHDGSQWLDGDIALLVGYDNVIHGYERDGEPVVRGLRKGEARELDVPCYSRSMDAAETLWLPDAWERGRQPMPTPVECCLAALCDRWCFDADRLSPH